MNLYDANPSLSVSGSQHDLIIRRQDAISDAIKQLMVAEKQRAKKLFWQKMQQQGFYDQEINKMWNKL